MAAQARQPAGAPAGGQFAASTRGEADVDLAEPGSWTSAVDRLALDDMEPGETRILHDVDPNLLISHGYSVEYDSDLAGLAEHLDATRLDRYAALDPASAPPIIVTLPPSGEEESGPTVIDGHHRLFAAHCTGRPVGSVAFHAPVVDADGDVDYPTLPRRFGGLA